MLAKYNVQLCVCAHAVTIMVYTVNDMQVAGSGLLVEYPIFDIGILLVM